MCIFVSFLLSKSGRIPYVRQLLCQLMDIVDTEGQLTNLRERSTLGTWTSRSSKQHVCNLVTSYLALNSYSFLESWAAQRSLIDHFRLK